MSALTLRRLTKRFPGTAQAAVDAVDLVIPEGALVTLLGPSGCGKTTLLRLITGFLQPDDGAIFIGDEDITRLPPHQRDIGMVYQSYALWPHMSVAANVAFGLEMRGVARAERAERVKQVLALVGLDAYAERSPTQLSGGQQQRVALARALVIRPRVLLLDEPLSSLDATLRRHLRFYIRDLQQQLGVTTVFVTHDQEEALAVSDRVVLMREGGIVQMGSGQELYQQPGSAFALTFMGEANVLPAEVRAIDADGTVQLATTLGELRCMPPPSVLRGLAAGARARVGIRPEDILLAAPGDAAAANDRGWSGTGAVQSATFLGPWQRLQVAAGQPPTRLEVRVPTSRAHEQPIDAPNNTPPSLEGAGRHTASPAGYTPPSLEGKGGQGGLGHPQPGDRVWLRIPPASVMILRDDEADQTEREPGRGADADSGHEGTR